MKRSRWFFRKDDRLRRGAVACAMLLVTVVLAGCEGSRPEKSATSVDPVPVETTTLEAEDFVDTVQVAAVVEPRHEVRVSAEAPGRILAAPFEAGEKIERGKLLLRVDSQLDTARLNVLQNQVETAKREYRRTKMLAREGLATPQQLDQAEAAVESASLSLEQARVGIGKTSIRSPITGHVTTKFVEKGEYASPGAPLAHIVDYETVVIHAAVPESDLSYVKEGDEVKVHVPAFYRYVSGKVERRAIVADRQTRTFPVEIHVPNPDLAILPGMRATVIIPRKKYEKVVVVPRDAILQGFENQEAMVVPGEETTANAQLRKVTLGPARGNRVVVTEGLSAGDRLIVKGHRGIVDGTLVKVVGEKQAPSSEAGPTDAEEKNAPDDRPPPTGEKDRPATGSESGEGHSAKREQQDGEGSENRLAEKKK